MNLLVFETTTPSGGAALFVDGLLAGEMMVTNPQAHSRSCLRFAEQLLDAARMQWKDLDAVATSHGPGSFTGVRVGLTLAKGLGWSLGLKSISVSTPEALAWQMWSGEDAACLVPLIDARIDEVYGAVFRIEEGKPARLVDDFCAKPAEVPALIDEAPALFAGEGALRYYEEFLHGAGQLARRDRVRLTPAATGWLALQKLEAGESTPPEDLCAVYLRDPVRKRPSVS